ncbi:YciI family protein [Rhodococcus sp. BP22]|uniref:YciI family protein n=1 Tax=Rhodococcus sp. BP22 TaxID=2758566 RepID=UPI0016479246|nr:YciI family protein [Rhodococcus sp. BP22]
MKYMLLINAPSADFDNGCSVEDWIQFGKEMQDAGVWVTGHALADLTTATTVQVDASGQRSITDGPFAETREVLGGFEVIDVPDLDAALHWAERCPGSRGGGAVVVRPIADF